MNANAKNSSGLNASGNPKLDSLYKLWGPPITEKAREARELIIGKKILRIDKEEKGNADVKEGNEKA